MKEVWQWIVRWKCQTVAWCKRQFTWWIEQAIWVQVFAFAFSVLVGLLVIIALAFIGYGLFCIDTDIARNLILLTGGIVGWYFLARRTNIAAREANISEQNIEITKQNRKDNEKNIANERINFATEQLDSEKPPIRLSGIRSLGKISATHEEECMEIARVLVSFIRTQAAKNSERTMEDIARCDLSNLETMDDFSAYRAQRLDIEAAVTTLASIASALEKMGKFSEEYNEQKVQLCDLQNTDLRGLRFIGADLSQFDLAGADMSGAWLVRVNFTEAWLYKAHFRERTKLCFAKLEGANFTRAYLNFVDFHGIELPREAKFKGAYLHGAIFTGIQIMTKIDFTDALLDNTNFMGTHLSQVKIGGHSLSLKNANLTGSSFLSVIDLQKRQLEEAFRWKGYSTFVTNDEGTLKPPPEKDRPEEFESCVSNGYEWGFYKDSIGEWRWIRAMQGSEIDDSSNEGYEKLGDCIVNAEQHGMNGYPTPSR